MTCTNKIFNTINFIRQFFFTAIDNIQLTSVSKSACQCVSANIVTCSDGAPIFNSLSWTHWTIKIKKVKEFYAIYITYFWYETATDSVVLILVINEYRSWGLREVASAFGNSLTFVIKSIGCAFGSELALEMSNS